jgi:hypothetical protein
VGALFVLSVSCSNQKPATENATTAPVEGKEFVTGKVTTQFAGEGCAVLVKLDGAEGKLLLPVGLDQSYQKEGLMLRFTYRLSRASMGSCRQGQTAILEDITVLPGKPQRMLEDK